VFRVRKGTLHRGVELTANGVLRPLVNQSLHKEAPFMACLLCRHKLSARAFTTKFHRGEIPARRKHRREWITRISLADKLAV
jgi:hypothetical protein